MAVEANQAKHTYGRRTVSRRREILERVMLGVAALLLVIGLVVYLQKRADNELVPPAAPAQSAKSTPAPQLAPGGKLDPSARRTATTFIRAALAREDLLKAWNLATPELRGGVTKKQWLRGEMPFPPFPVANLATTGFRVLGNSPKEVLLEVLLVPQLKSGYAPTRYEVTLVRRSAEAPWRVSYFLPYAPPGKFAEPDS